MDLPVWTALPFVLLLAGIALLPVVRGRWWHFNRNKALVSFGLALPVVVYLLAADERTGGESSHLLFHELGEFASFIILLMALYTIAGGIVLTGDLTPLPRNNTLILGFGALLANVVGTTGSSMVLIRPLLRINRHRQHRVHLPIFFIIVVSNTGGLLTPLGDPPLFLGFLQGVDFFWTLKLWPQWLLVNSVALALFYFIDSAAYRRESDKSSSQAKAPAHNVLGVVGLRVNGPLMLGVLIVVLLEAPSAGQWAGWLIGAGDLTLSRPWGELVMVTLTTASLLFTRSSIRRHNEFAWGPIIEVSLLFAGIFVTMTPALALLRHHGAALNLTRPWQYFWLTGTLSAFLDNAPTYLTFATLAASPHDLAWLSTQRPTLLAAISCGAVFMGALTYIGNGPNFMVKAIAEEQGYRMPSFFGYIRYSGAILLPIFIGVALLFF